MIKVKAMTQLSLDEWCKKYPCPEVDKAPLYYERSFGSQMQAEEFAGSIFEDVDYISLNPDFDELNKKELSTIYKVVKFSGDYFVVTHELFKEMTGKI